jgi:serine protease Do
MRIYDDRPEEACPAFAGSDYDDRGTFQEGPTMRAVFTIAITAATAVALHPAFAATTGSASNVVETTVDQVQSCKPLGQVVGESAMCVKSRGKASALSQAASLGATHIVWVEVRCQPFVGEKATARIFDCSPHTPSLDDGFENYLESQPDLAGRTMPSTSSPRVMASSNLDADVGDLRSRGFVLVGYEGVTGGRVPLDTIRKKAMALGAEIALVQSKSAGEDVEYQAMTTYGGGGPRVGISTGSVVGTQGGVPVIGTTTGSSITGSPGSRQTQMVPFSQRRYDTQVLCFRKLRPGPLGLYLDLIPTELRARLSRNTGAFVIAVADETPAFFANIVSGDIIISVDGTEVRTPKELAVLLQDRSGGRVKMTVLRGDKQLEIEVSRN